MMLCDSPKKFALDKLSIYKSRNTIGGRFPAEWGGGGGGGWGVGVLSFSILFHLPFPFYLSAQYFRATRILHFLRVGYFFGTVEPSRSNGCKFISNGLETENR